MKKILFLVVLMVAASKAYAQDWHVQIHGLSYHPQRTQSNGERWNEINAGIGLRYQITNDWDVQAGIYKNSEYLTSRYVIATWLPVVAGNIRAGMFAGAVDGYKYRNGAVIPAGGLAARWQGERVSLTARFVPQYKQLSEAVVTVELGWKL